MSLRLDLDDHNAGKIRLYLACDRCPEHAIMLDGERRPGRVWTTFIGTWYPRMHTEAVRAGWRFTVGGEHVGPCCNRR